jgi:hypothetical protein
MPSFPRSLAVLATSILVGVAGRADDLPSPEAMWLGQRIVPRTLVQGFREGVEEGVLDRVLGTRVAAMEQPSLRARARMAMAPILDEAFPPEVLAGIGAQFLARHYTADELRALRTREESPLGRKLRDLDRSAAELAGATPAAREEAREALARRAFTDSERKELEAFAVSPLGRKGRALGPELAGTFVDQLERRYASLRPDLEPRLENAAEAVLLAPGK